jgi:hypothetical protein
MADLTVTAQAATAQQAEEDNKFNAPNPPLKISAIPAWGVGLAMGEVLAGGFMESDPEFMAAIEASGLAAEEFTNVMQGVMVQVTKGLGESTEFLKELDDDEGCAGTAIFKQ